MRSLHSKNGLLICHINSPSLVSHKRNDKQFYAYISHLPEIIKILCILDVAFQKLLVKMKKKHESNVKLQLMSFLRN